MESFLGRPLDGGPYPYVWLDGLTQQVREGGRNRERLRVVATINADGQQDLTQLSGVELVTSDSQAELAGCILYGNQLTRGRPTRPPELGNLQHPQERLNLD